MDKEKEIEEAFKKIFYEIEHLMQLTSKYANQKGLEGMQLKDISLFMED